MTRQFPFWPAIAVLAYVALAWLPCPSCGLRAAVVMLAVAAIAIWRLQAERRGAGDSRLTLADIVDVGRQAAQSLRGNRWIATYLWIAIAVAVVEGAIWTVAILKVIPLTGQTGAMDILRYHAFTLAKMARYMAEAAFALHPDVAVSSMTGLTVAFAICALPAYLALDRSPGIQADRRVARSGAMMLPVAAVALALAVASTVSQYRLVLNHTGAQTPVGACVLFRVADVAASALVMSAILAGLIGSVLRMRRGESVTWRTFVEDWATNWLPIAGFQLLLSVAGSLLTAGIQLNIAGAVASPVIQAGSLLRGALYVLTAFVPVAIVVNRSGMREGIADGVRAWIENWRTMLPAAAIGAAAIPIVWICRDIVSDLLRAPMPAGLFSPGQALVDPLVTPFFVAPVKLLVTVVVVELYCRLSQPKTGSEHELEESPVD